MLKPEQIANAKFTPVSTGTYSAEEVDAFLGIVAEAYQDSLNEKADLLKKMGVLADKVESYRKDEDAIKGALLDAHRMAESLNRSAAEKAENTINEANEEAASIKADAEKNAAELSAAARTQAGEIVTNAKNAVESIKSRAQMEADTTIANASAQAKEIIANANNQSTYIIGSSKKDYEFYSRELEKVKAELEKFRAMVEMLCSGEVTPEMVAEEINTAASDIPAVVEPEAEEAYVAPEIPVVEEAEAEAEEEIPAVPVEAEPIVPFEKEDEEDDDLFDFLSLDADDAEESIASDLDSILPDPHFEAPVEEIPAYEEIPAAPIEAAPAYEEAPVIEEAPAAAEDDEDDFFKEFSAELDFEDDGLNIPGTSSADDDDDITSLFDSLFD